MTVPTEVDEIGIRFTVTAFNGKKDKNHAKGLAGFVLDRQNLKILFPDISRTDLSDKQGYELVVEYINRFWPTDRVCIATVTDVSMDKREKLYLVHPVLEGAATARYLGKKGIPAFRCVLQDGYFLVIGFEAGFYPDSGSQQVVLAGPVYTQLPPAPGEVLVKTRPPKSFPLEVLDALSALKSKRLFVSQKIENWLAFLDWNMKIAYQRQVGCHYDSIEIDESTHSLRFNVSASRQQWQKVIAMRSFPVSAVPLSASKNPEHWVPVVDNSRGLSLGELSVPKKQLSRILNNNLDEQLSCTLEICLDTKQWDKCFNRIPEEGFLISEIFSNIVPLQRQKSALNKLVKGEYVNPYLPDFLFDAAKARIPDAPVLGLEPADAEYLFGVLEAELNDEQKLALAKIRGCPDVAFMQAGPGTGKTTVLAYFCALSVHYGQRALVASQANVAVSKILDSLPEDSRIRPLQIVRKEKGKDSAFAEDNVVYTWLTRVRDVCSKQLSSEQKLVTEREEIDHIWPHFAEIAEEYKKLTKRCTTTEKRLKQTEENSVKLAGILNEHKHRESVLSSAAASIEQTINQLSNYSTVTDLGEWVKLIDASERGGIFGPLKSWYENNCLPDIVQPLLADPPDDTEGTSASTGSSGKSLVKRLIQCFAPQQGQQPSGAKTEPNWAVLLINSNTLLKRLRDLQKNLPEVLELCREAERLCTIAAMAASKVSEAEWAEVTKNLAGALESSGKVVADVLKIDNIATSLRPKKSFTAKLTKAGIFLQKVLSTVPSSADELQKALMAVAEVSVTYLNNRLTETSKQTRWSQSKLNSLKHQLTKTAESLTNIQEKVKQLESAWTETFNTLPCALQLRISHEVPPIGSKGSKMLNKGQASYLKDTEDAINHHKLWGGVQKRFIRHLKQPTETDNSRLIVLYLQYCNVVAATCSQCGNWGGFLSRDECRQFDVTVIDEVSKATPTELLMPVLLAGKVIYSGDYRQLPPTFKEGRRLERSYNELDEIGIDLEQVARFNDMVTAGLFKQLYQESPDVLKQGLVIEYRFPEQILEVVNQFNDPLLQCGLDSSNERFDHGLHIKMRSGEFLTPENHVLWLDTSRDSKGHRVRERQAGTSKVNDVEARSVIKLIKLLNESAGKAGKNLSSVGVGVITFYGAQVRLLGNLLSRLKPADSKFLNIRINTVDDFQGEERDIIILSMVRAKPGRIGKFVKQYERVHVAMSRAKKLLIVVGSADTFRKVDVPILAAAGKTIIRRCYANILGIVKKYGGLRNTKELF